MWARLDGCILDKIPWTSVSGASWAGRGGQSCCIQLRILNITVLVAWVLETREARCVWGVRQPKQIDIYESVSENQIDTVRKSGRDDEAKKKGKQVPEDLMGGFGWASSGCKRAGGDTVVCPMRQTWRRHAKKRMAKEEIWEKKWKVRGEGGGPGFLFTTMPPVFFSLRWRRK